MAENILKIQGLHAGIEGEEILHGLDLEVAAGETHVLMGPNGAGKSTLGNVIMGSPVYNVSSGSVIFNGEDITKESVDSRAKKGLFLSFQNPLEVPGLSLEAFLRNAIRESTGKPVKVYASKKQRAETCGTLEEEDA